ncbi:MAG: outer membrane beta-barrel protein [Bacteroidales bacterium]|nr:outer membrane beta-barrel protein [Bacteroidales bacterium]
MRKKILFTFLTLCAASIGYSQDKNPLGFQAEFGYSLGISNSKHEVYKFLITPGVNINDNMFLGVGIGYLNFSNGDYYTSAHDFKTTFSSLPLYANFKYSTELGRYLSPFIGVKAGYQLINKNKLIDYQDASFVYNYDGGIFLSPEIGVNFDFVKNSKLFLALTYDCLGYKIKSESSFFELTNNNNNGSIIKNTTNKIKSGIGLTIGVSF